MSDTMRDAFESSIKDLFDPYEHTFNRTATGVYYNAVKCKTYGGQCPAEYAPVSMLFELWQAAQSQPAPPVQPLNNPDELEPVEFLASRLIDAWCAAHGKQIPWAKAVEITAIVTKMPDAERARLLNMD